MRVCIVMLAFGLHRQHAEARTHSAYCDMKCRDKMVMAFLHVESNQDPSIRKRFAFQRR